MIPTQEARRDTVHLTRVGNPSTAEYRAVQRGQLLGLSDIMHVVTHAGKQLQRQRHFWYSYPINILPASGDRNAEAA